MKTPETTTSSSHSPLPYIFGFLLSLILTFAAYLLVVNKLASTSVILGGIFVLALLQLLVQLLFFLHMGSEKKPRLNLIAFLFMAVVVSIIGFGSIWIMNNLNYRMTPSQASDYLKKDEGY